MIYIGVYVYDMIMYIFIKDKDIMMLFIVIKLYDKQNISFTNIIKINSSYDENYI